ncbi:MAG: phosphoribosylaminoimidazolesuccinocarboxamide synthase [Deltaproteobacteria bacterium CG11_big_fil_rev_8_21_14_0_20_47_16]|nr:MAG: phosphoribosylaminoimidazolesuccinocarboxamide synthase [Deltaproteobacteria bacterium CG11_big_fil_rev_8_21_14_0_20_47_16]
MSEKLYEGKAKVLYATDDPQQVIQYFKDDATAFNAQKRGTIVDKGVMNCAISSKIFQELEKVGVPTHFISQKSEREMLVKRLKIVPIEVVVRNVIAGSLAKRMGRPEGESLPNTIVELYYKDDALGDPMINDDHVFTFKLATPDDLTAIRRMAVQVNNYLKSFFDRLGIRLVDFKLEFGRDVTGQLVLGDEITPDGCRLWDKATNEKMDKDRFRRDLGGVEEAYQKVYQLVTGA